ncbi:hypothetical protein HNR60_001147 [Rhodopseudomonas rhenobacensis]|uniref:Uncharacterized protein n=1 Tax=Rhodopseudomonas rhenobacensis TaxID=87461 RepID=A0A7W7Z1T7_9BRAD|nr:hypothetical protein [Rhodopseudomonas rhenobacensis]MBB5046402.1 hypothetical protein [Rhodopseudomonas rhenobacensis]
MQTSQSPSTPPRNDRLGRAQIAGLVGVAAVLVGLIYQFGYAFVISLALFETAAALIFLVYLIGSDAFAKRGVKAAEPVAKPRVRRADRVAPREIERNAA